MVSYRKLPVVKTLFSFEKKKNLFDLFQKVKVPFGRINFKINYFKIQEQLVVDYITGCR